VARDSSAELTSNDGFSVVAPMKVNRPDSTCGRKASCCALLKRCTSSTKTTVRGPRRRSSRACLDRLADVLHAGQHGRQHDEVGVDGRGHQPRQRGLAHARRAPQDHRVQRPPSMATRSGRPGPAGAWPDRSPRPGRSARGRRRSASGNLGAKTTLVEPADGRLGFRVAYGVGLSKSGSGSFEHDGSSVIGLLTRALGDGLLGHVNLGWSHSRLERASSTVWSLGMETGGDLVWAADLFGDDRSRPWASAGLGWSVLERFSVNAAYAVQFENPRVRQFSLGLKIGF
jgi:hypothetical protein